MTDSYDCDVCIIGAGLAGSTLANDLFIQGHSVCVVDKSYDLIGYSKLVSDIGIKGNNDDIGGIGIGGSTQLWHNGLIEVDEQIFNDSWPFSKSELSPFYESAWHLLCSSSRSNIYSSYTSLRTKFINLGIDVDLLSNDPLYYPNKRINVWDKFNLKDKVDLIVGEITSLTFSESINDLISVSAISINTNKSSCIVKPKYVVFSAGGLFTPLLLKKYLPKDTYTGIGKGYSDHPSAFVGKLRSKKNFFRLWNFSCLNGKMRIPFVIHTSQLAVSFQLRPSFPIINKKRNKYFKSILSAIRNNPFKLGLYLKLFSNLDDLIEILSFKYGFMLNTNFYHILMVAEQLPSREEVFFEDNKNYIRNWKLTAQDLEQLEEAISKFSTYFSDHCESINIFTDWNKNIFSSSHHSGSVTIGNTRDYPCDKDCKLTISNNIFVCDGSVIPRSGYSNTGLTIAALSLRASKFISQLLVSK